MLAGTKLRNVGNHERRLTSWYPMYLVLNEEIHEGNDCYKKSVSIVPQINSLERPETYADETTILCAVRQQHFY